MALQLPGKFLGKTCQVVYHSSCVCCNACVWTYAWQIWQTTLQDMCW